MKAGNSTKIYISRYVDEDEDFWNKHISKFKISGLKRKDYCAQNGVNYPRFNYWIMKLSKVVGKKVENEVSKKLLPVQLKLETEISEITAPLSLTLKNGYILDIHNVQGLSIILEKLI